VGSTLNVRLLKSSVALERIFSPWTTKPIMRISRRCIRVAFCPEFRNARRGAGDIGYVTGKYPTACAASLFYNQEFHITKQKADNKLKSGL
jgi:hypothetical protein